LRAACRPRCTGGLLRKGGSKVTVWHGLPVTGPWSHRDGGRHDAGPPPGADVISIFWFRGMSTFSGVVGAKTCVCRVSHFKNSRCGCAVWVVSNWRRAALTAAREWTAIADGDIFRTSLTSRSCRMLGLRRPVLIASRISSACSKLAAGAPGFGLTGLVLNDLSAAAESLRARPCPVSELIRGMLG
jgi:hypothetical protein